MNWDVGFVTYTMQEIGVPLPRLLEVYDQLFKARVRKITTQKKKEKKKWGGGGRERIVFNYYQNFWQER